MLFVHRGETNTIQILIYPLANSKNKELLNGFHTKGMTTTYLVLLIVVSSYTIKSTSTIRKDGSKPLRHLSLLSNIKTKNVDGGSSREKTTSENALGTILIA